MVDATYALEILNRAVAERNDSDSGIGGQAAVGRELGCSSSLISQLQSSIYGSPDKWYRLIIERYGNETINCPTLGEIPLITCASERDKPSGMAPSAAYVRQRRACQNCERRS